MWRKTPRPTPDHIRMGCPIPDTPEQWIPDASFLPDLSLIADPIDVSAVVVARPPLGTEPPPAMPKAAERHSGPSGPVGPSCRVLLVDDRQERRALMRMVVETGPASTSVVAEASTASAAVAALDRDNPNVAVVDIASAVPSGLAVITALRAERPWLPIVVCSFQSDLATQLAAILAGANAYLAKPVSPQDLLSACRTPVTASTKGPRQTQNDSGRSPARVADSLNLTSLDATGPGTSHSNHHPRLSQQKERLQCPIQSTT